MNEQFSPTAQPPVKQYELKRPWFRFSVKSLLILTAIVSLIMAMFAAPGVFAIGVCIFHVILSGALLIGLIYGRGWIQAFAMTASIPHILAWIFFTFEGPGPGPEALLVVGLIVQSITFASGFIGAVFHGALARRGGKIPVPNLPLVRHWFSNGNEN